LQVLFIPLALITLYKNGGIKWRAILAYAVIRCVTYALAFGFVTPLYWDMYITLVTDHPQFYVRFQESISRLLMTSTPWSKAVVQSRPLVDPLLLWMLLSGVACVWVWKLFSWIALERGRSSSSTSSSGRGTGFVGKKKDE
jgi:hypothetical protein